ncbi:1-deoxy-D-xylulose-5-phosphate synthase N-terminal domain-containing protein [Micromonospora sp. M12]
MLFDTGHQAYVHKIVTGRQAGFDKLRQRGGLSGYPSQAESEHDLVENSHASTALSYADGLAKAYALRGEARSVVAVVGDGALTGGMCWEALNNIATAGNPWSSWSTTTVARTPRPSAGWPTTSPRSG